LGYLFFDTGVLYRAVTLLALRSGVDSQDASGLAALTDAHVIDVEPRPSSDTGYAVLIDGRDATRELRLPEVAGMVSPVSAHGEVRAAVLPPQRRIADRGNVVMVGRDIGTVVLPGADLKIFLDASAEARARRRFRERLAWGEQTAYSAVLETVRSRDAIDAGRAVAPLRAAPDAVIVNTDECDLPGVVDHLATLAGRWPDDLTTRGGESPCLPRGGGLASSSPVGGSRPAKPGGARVRPA
jgi:cytidylate kinase